MSYLDKAFCASPNCKNECGRRMTDEERANIKYSHGERISYSYFCGGNHENEMPWSVEYQVIPNNAE